MRRLPAPPLVGAEPNAIVCPFSRVTSSCTVPDDQATRRGARRPLAADSPIRRRACAMPMGLRYRNRSGGRNGLFVSSWPIDAPGLPCVLQTIADQASGQSSGGYPSRGPPAPPSRRRLLAGSHMQRGRGPTDPAVAHSRTGSEPCPACSSLERGEVDHPDRDVDRPARSSSSAQCREDASIARIHGDRHRHSAREALRCVAPDESHRKKGTLLQEPGPRCPSSEPG